MHPHAFTKSVSWLAAACGLALTLSSALSFAAAPAAPAASAEQQGVETLDYDPADPGIQAAVKEARKTLPGFLKLTTTPASNIAMVAVKVEIRQGKEREYIWVTPFKVEGSGYKGQVNDIPRRVRTVKTGEFIAFTREDIVDWAYMDTHARQLRGNYTTCVLLKRGPASEREQLKRSYGLDCDRH